MEENSGTAQDVLSSVDSVIFRPVCFVPSFTHVTSANGQMARRDTRSVESAHMSGFPVSETLARISRHQEKRETAESLTAQVPYEV